MIKQVLAGVAAIGTVSGVALAQTYISVSPPPAAFVPPSVVAPRTPTSPAGNHRGGTIEKVVNRKSNTGIEKGLLAGAP